MNYEYIKKLFITNIYSINTIKKPINKNVLYIELIYYTVYNIDVKINDNNKKELNIYSSDNYESIIIIFKYKINNIICFYFNKDVFLEIIIFFQKLIKLDKLKKNKSVKKKIPNNKYEMLFITIKYFIENYVI